MPPPQVTEREQEVERSREIRALDLADKSTAERIAEAEAKGRREQLVDSRLDGHQARLDAVNGSIERGAKATENLGQKVDDLAGKIETADAVGQALARSATDAIAASVSRRDFRIAVAVLFVMLLGILVTAIVAILH